MTRLSSDELRDGHVFNGFDYNIQVWVVEGIIRSCGHPAWMRAGVPCCSAYRYAGQPISEVPGAETFPPEMTQRA
ncbi:MAG TPA: hypothetical protein VNN10_07535 [Dehalococcoidia bacterium]|nr:hypothetical protein [Dehalococcoidia bacterium]